MFTGRVMNISDKNNGASSRCFPVGNFLNCDEAYRKALIRKKEYVCEKEGTCTA
jgi:hypothetical protein